MNQADQTKVWFFMGRGIALAMVLLAVDFLTPEEAQADEEQAVTRRAGEIGNNQQQRQESSGADESNAEKVTIPQSQGAPVVIQSKTFVAPGGWHFAPFSGANPVLVDAFNNGLFSFSPVVTPTNGPSSYDSSVMVPKKVRVQWTTTAEPLTMDQWGLGAEGNLKKDPRKAGNGPGDGPPPPPPPKAHWAAKVKTLCVQLGVDSANEYGPTIPDERRKEMLQRATGDKQAVPGKIVLANINDDDNNGAPDYADYGVPGYAGGTADRSLVPLLVAVPAGANLAGIKVALAYDMAEYVPANDKRVSLGTSNDTEYFDYRKFRQGKGKLRLWKLADAGGKRDPSKTFNQGGVLVKTGEAMDAASFFAGAAAVDMGSNASAKVVKLWVEGMNEGSGAVTAKLFRNGTELVGSGDQVNMAVAELSLGFNNENQQAVEAQGNLANTPLLPGTPDVAWTIDEFDEVTEDQGRGYPLWPGSQPEDTHPMKFTIPHALVAAGFKVEIMIENRGTVEGVIRRSVSSPSNLLEYHQAVISAPPQNAEVEWKAGAFGQTGEWRTVPSGISNVVLELPGGFTPASPRLKFRLSATKGGDSERMEGDSCICHYGENFWMLYSARNGVTGSATEKIDDPNSIGMSVYPQPQQSGLYNHRNPQVKNHLVYLHGYNTTFDQSVNSDFTRVFRRMYRAGYRGNFIGIAWEGDETKWAENVPADFDPNTENSLQTAEGLRHFLADTVRDQWGGGDVSHVDIAAHSMGNQVMWEALRLHARVVQNSLVQNAIGIEAAIWSSAFLNPTNDYPYPSATGNSLGVFGTKQQNEFTWNSWYQNDSGGGLGKVMDVTIAGQYIHCYNPYDDRLWNKMRVNDWVLRDDPDATISRGITAWTYGRDIFGDASYFCRTATDRANAVQACNGLRNDDHIVPVIHINPGSLNLRPGGPFVRSPIGGTTTSGWLTHSLAKDIPDLLEYEFWNDKIGQPSIHNYTFDDLILPAGAIDLRGVLTSLKYKNHLVNPDQGWREFGHSDHITEPLPSKVWFFYTSVLEDGAMSGQTKGDGHAN